MSRHERTLLRFIILNLTRYTPIAYRSFPFVLVVLLTSLQGTLGAGSGYWVYAVKTFLVAIVLLFLWKKIPELSVNFSWIAVLVGIAVFLIWIGFDDFYPKLNALGSEAEKETVLWNPFQYYGAHSLWGWFYVSVRLVGSVCLVPFVEETFYRSLVYRFIIKEKFEEVPIGKFVLVPFMVTSCIFGFAHNEWLAGIICGLAYQGVVCYKKRLGDAIVAHGITNLLLGIWVVWRGAWYFW